MRKERLFSEFPCIEKEDIILKKTEVSDFEDWYEIILSTKKKD